MSGQKNKGVTVKICIIKLIDISTYLQKIELLNDSNWYNILRFCMHKFVLHTLILNILFYNHYKSQAAWSRTEIYSKNCKLS